MKGAKSRFAIILVRRTKNTCLFYCGTKSVIQNISGAIEKLLREAQKLLGSRMPLSDPRLRTTGLDSRSGMRNLYAITGRINCGYRWRVANNIWFYPEIIPLSNYKGMGLLMTYYLSTCSSCRFVLTHFCILNWVTKILMRAISNAHASCIRPEGHRFPIPASLL